MKTKLKKLSAADKKITALFDTHYPNPQSELNFTNSYQLSISVLLSAQCTDKKVNEVTKVLFELYPDFKSLQKATLKSIEKIIRPINYYKTKSRHLIELANLVVNNFAGEFPLNRADAISLPGIGNKTANVILGEMKIEATLPVDTHVFRVSQRLGWAKGTTPAAIEMQLKARFPDEMWRNLHHWLILHGRKLCKAQRPLCSECPLLKLCPYVSKQRIKASE
jgi:endonuclease-3